MRMALLHWTACREHIAWREKVVCIKMTSWSKLRLNDCAVRDKQEENAAALDGREVDENSVERDS